VIDSGIAWILAPLIVASVALLGLSIFRLWRHGQQTDHLRRAERARHRVREQVWRMKNSRDIETVVYAVARSSTNTRFVSTTSASMSSPMRHRPECSSTLWTGTNSGNRTAN
jgi:biopolymer transport protein ExbB/TolQ